MKNSKDEITIDDIVESFAMRLETGERPSIQEYQDEYPHLAEQIAVVLPALLALENIDSDPGKRKLAVDDSIPELLGDYRIIQEIGRGGMGIVFEAQHNSLGRRVALKVLPKSSAEKSNFRKRFLTEARSAGQLHHTNIVPLFDVGESDGLHFYSMQYIHGDNLDHVIDDIRRLRQESRDNGSLQASGIKRRYEAKRQSECSKTIAFEMVNGHGEASVSSTSKIQQRSSHSDTAIIDRDAADSDPGSARRSVLSSASGTNKQRTRSQYHKRVASIGVQVADALAHAHDHGVLHRDVKPANLIMDTDGIVWVTDFGLAKFDTDDLTKTGDIIGTLRYMAPERFSGEADARSDIYSLGLTLYELSTLKCAFENERGTLVQDVGKRSSVASPRKIDETIPPDLETIILKAIEEQPERRYQSAKEMAEDLKLFLADRPIRARRVTWIEKAYRVCRRNPLASSLAACVAVLLIVTTAGSIQFARSELDNRKKSQKNLFLSKLDQAKMRRYSGRPGQRYEANRTIRDAVTLLPEMEFDSSKIRDTKFLLRSEVVAAAALTDIQQSWQHAFESGWGNRKRIAFDPTGEHFAEGHDDGRIRVRKIAGKEIVLELPGGRGDDPAWMMHFCPNGRYLISKYHQPNVHDEYLTIVWDVKNEGRQCYLTRHAIEFCFSHDSSCIAITYADRAEVVRLSDGQVVRMVYPEFLEDGNASRIALNSDGSSVAISQFNSGVIEFWNIEDDPVLSLSVECENPVFCMDWDSDREIFAVGAHRGTLHYWFGDLQKEPQTIHLHQNSVHEIHLHPTHDLVATTAWDATTRFTDLVSGKEVLSVEDHELNYNGFFDDGRLGLSDDNGEAGVWEVALPMVQYYSAPAKQGAATCCVHPKFNDIVVRNYGTEKIEFWNINRRELLRTIDIEGVWSVAFSNSGDYFFSSGDGGLQRWRVRCDEKSLRLDERILIVKEATRQIEGFDESERLLVAVGNQVKMVDSLKGDVVREFGEHPGLTRLQITADDRYALTGAWRGKGLKIWDVQTGECVQTIYEQTVRLAPAAHPTDPTKFFCGSSRNSEFEIVPNSDDSVASPAQLVRELKYQQGPMRLSPDGRIMMIRTNSFNLLLLDAETEEELANIVSVGRSRIIDWMISPDGKRLLLACFDSLQVLDLEQYQTDLKDLRLNW